MTRRAAFLLATMILATTAMARERSTRSISAEALRPGPATMVSGTVSSVSGHLVALAGGAVVVDATNAKISSDRGEATTIGAITPGSMIVAVIRAADFPPNAPLPAMSIAVMRAFDVTLSGPVQAVDLLNSTFTLLGRTIRVTAETSFGGLRAGTEIGGLADLQPNQVVQVQANAVGGALVAAVVRVFAALPPPTVAFRGTVKSIGTESWVITGADGDVTVIVNAQTKIVGSPKVGDVVEVVATIDSSNAYVALTIMKREDPRPPLALTFRGVVRAISGTSWSIAVENKREIAVQITSSTKIAGDPKLGDRVEVVAERTAGGGFVALSITKL